VQKLPLEHQVGHLREVGAQRVLAVSVRGDRALSCCLLTFAALVSATLCVTKHERERRQCYWNPKQLKPVPQRFRWLADGVITRRDRRW
jgi:hypothetical protein